MIAADAQLIGWLKEKSTLKLHFCRVIEIWANEKVLPAGMWLIPAEMLTQHAHTHTHTQRHEGTRLVNEICHVKKYVRKKSHVRFTPSWVTQMLWLFSAMVIFPASLKYPCCFFRAVCTKRNNEQTWRRMTRGSPFFILWIIKTEEEGSHTKGRCPWSGCRPSLTETSPPPSSEMSTAH